ncbi:MAG: regulatory protein RecX [Eubacteriales bacterium]|nr:regulatory protein RecX [Eubacteriales bacterium]
MAEPGKSKAERLAQARAIIEKYEANSRDITVHEESYHVSPDDKEAFQNGRFIALSYIGIDKGKSTGQVRNKLRTKDLPDDLIEQVIVSLKTDDYLDDRRACGKIARRHQGTRAKSRRYLRELFIKQGVDPKVAEAYLEELPEDQKSILELIPGSIPGDPREYQRLLRRLQSRGYSYNTIRQAMRQQED